MKPFKLYYQCEGEDWCLHEEYATFAEACQGWDDLCASGIEFNHIRLEA